MPELQEKTPEQQKFDRAARDRQRREESKAAYGKETYHKVRFYGKSSPNDTDDVILAVNGEILTMQRQKDVIVPGRFLVVGDNATYDQFRQVPGKDRKVVATISVYPRQDLGTATEIEYNKFKRQGDKIQKKNIAKYGFNVDPEDIE